ncbi:MAG: macro domain-containing protein [Fibrobacter sp.]|nr:macro domain-containing protein [Fibrobacter sp.]
MPLTIVRNDISKVKADAIVNSANKNPVCGGGAEYHIYEAAGYDKLLAAREKIGVLDVAEVAVSPAFALKAKYLIHVVGPKWNGGESGETSALASCYRRALEKALELGCESIAFPLISSGVFRFPKDSALKIALQAIGEFLQSHEMDVQLVVFDRKAFDVSEELCDDIQAYIDDNYVRERYSGVRESARWNENGVSADFEKCDFYENSFVVFNRAEASHAIYEQEEKSLEEMLATAGDTFCGKLFALIREKNQDDVEVYKRANLDRKHFSKIRSNVNYKPTKKTALALAIALQLNLDETKDLLSRAELALSPSSKGDLIVSYFITHQKYDIWEINSMLFKFGQPTLGA